MTRPQFSWRAPGASGALPHHRPVRGARRARAARRRWTWVAVAAAKGQRLLLPPTAQFRDLARPRTPPTSTRRTRRTHPPRRAAPRGVRRRDAGPRWLSRSPWNVRFSAAVVACRLPVAGRRSSFFGTPARRRAAVARSRFASSGRRERARPPRDATRGNGAVHGALDLRWVIWGCLGRARAAPSLLFRHQPASQPAGTGATAQAPSPERPRSDERPPKPPGHQRAFDERKLCRMGDLEFPCTTWNFHAGPGML